MARPKKKVEEEEAVAAFTTDQQSPTCEGCFYAESMNSDVWRQCNLQLPSFFKTTGPPVVHRYYACSFHTPKG